MLHANNTVQFLLLCTLYYMFRLSIFSEIIKTNSHFDVRTYRS